MLRLDNIWNWDKVEIVHNETIIRKEVLHYIYYILFLSKCYDSTSSIKAAADMQKQTATTRRSVFL